MTDAMNTSLMTIDSESMALELVELSEDELDTVAGGASLDFGSASQFFQKDVVMGQQTFAGPNGAGTTNFFASREVASAASQFFKASD